jgi:hypothetical protein
VRSLISVEKDGRGLAGTGLAGTGLAGTGLTGTGLTGTGLTGTGLAATRDSGTCRWLRNGRESYDVRARLWIRRRAS